MIHAFVLKKGTLQKSKNWWSLCDEIPAYLPESKNILKAKFPFKSDEKPSEAKIKVAWVLRF